jgi:SAM-dependent methyltransferase
MAKIEIIKPATENSPALTEIIEARVWGLGGTAQQSFYIGSGSNVQANGNFWLEVIYSVEGAQIFYTRNFLHYYHYIYGDNSSPETQLDELAQKGEGRFGLGDMLPDTNLTLILEKFTYDDENGKKEQYTQCKLEISTDTGAVFGWSSPGDRSVDIKLDNIELEEGVRFMRELIHDIEAVRQGCHPDPASFPEGSSEWPFIWQLNAMAYNKISESYGEPYFENPLLSNAFDGWLSQVLPRGQILDAGCGHGQPVIARLLEKGFQVSGSDFSEAMLQKASQQFPQVRFLQKTTTMIREQAAYNGICSFNSMLYLDPIDLLHSIYRLHKALKTGGQLFLYAFDAGPDWRGEPFGYRLDQWMWSWHYGMEEAASLLEEHGYFKVVEAQKVQEDPGEGERIAQELEKEKQKEEEYIKRQKSTDSSLNIPFLQTPIERSPYAYVLIAQRCEK